VLRLCVQWVTMWWLLRLCLLWADTLSVVRLLLARGGTLCVVGGVRRGSLRFSMVHCLCRQSMPPLFALTRLFGPQLPKQLECLVRGALCVVCLLTRTQYLLGRSLFAVYLLLVLGGPLRVVCLLPVLGRIRCVVRRCVLGAKSCVVCLLLARRGTL
jgi:hypothetical protein